MLRLDAELDGFDAFGDGSLDPEGSYLEFRAGADDAIAEEQGQKQQRRAANNAAATTAAVAAREVAPAAAAVGRRRRDRAADGGRGDGSLRSEVPDELLPKVAIVGRPNVGKSGEFMTCGCPGRMLH